MADLTGEAKALLNNPAFKDAITRAQQDLLTKLLACDPKDDTGRRLYAEAANIVGKVSSHIVALATTTDAQEQPVEDFYAEKAKSRFSALFGN